MASFMEPLATLEGHTDRVWHVSWDPTGSYLASCSGDKAIRIWGAAEKKMEGPWKLLATLEDGQTRTIRSCEWSPDGKYLASVSFDAMCVIWELQRPNDGLTMEWEMVATLEGHENEVKSVAWNPAGTLLATSSRDKSVWIWEGLDDNDFECLSVLHGHQQDVKFVTFHPREDLLFSASYDDTIKVWEEGDDDWQCVETLTGHTSTVWGLSFGPTGDEMVSCSDDASLIVWRRLDGKWVNVRKLSDYHKATIYSVSWSQTHGAIASGAADDSIRVFVEGERTDPAAADPPFACDVEQAHAHDSDVNCVRWNPVHGDVLASAGDDHVVKIWRYRSDNLMGGGPASDSSVGASGSSNSSST